MDEIKIYVRELGLGININYPEIRCSMKVMERIKLSMRMIMMAILRGRNGQSRYPFYTKQSYHKN